MVDIVTTKHGYCWIGLARAQTRKLFLQIKIVQDTTEFDEIAKFQDTQFKPVSNIFKDQMVIARHSP